MTDAEVEAHIAELDAAVEAEHAAIRDALARGVVVFPCRYSLKSHRIKVSPIGTLGCPPRHLGLTQWGCGAPIRSIYVTPAQAAHEIWARGFRAPA